MTRRLTIVLDESVTETECGVCLLIDAVPGHAYPFGCRRWCAIFGNVDRGRSPKCLEAERAAASVERSLAPSESDVRAAAAEAGVDVDTWEFTDDSVCVGDHEKHEVCVYRSFDEAIGILRSRKAGR